MTTSYELHFVYDTKIMFRLMKYNGMKQSGIEWSEIEQIFRFKYFKKKK
jgi:hypothetical protein